MSLHLWFLAHICSVGISTILSRPLSGVSGGNLTQTRRSQKTKQNKNQVIFFYSYCWMPKGKLASDVAGHTQVQKSWTLFLSESVCLCILLLAGFVLSCCGQALTLAQSQSQPSYRIIKGQNLKVMQIFMLVTIHKYKKNHKSNLNGKTESCFAPRSDQSLWWRDSTERTLWKTEGQFHAENNSCSPNTK